MIEDSHLKWSSEPLSACTWNRTHVLCVPHSECVTHLDKFNEIRIQCNSHCLNFCYLNISFDELTLQSFHDFFSPLSTSADIEVLLNKCKLK